VTEQHRVHFLQALEFYARQMKLSIVILLQCFTEFTDASITPSQTILA